MPAEDNKVSLKVNFPMEVKSLLKSHYEYLIEGKDDNSIVKIKRRYKEFFILREKLILIFIGTFIPSVHTKDIDNKNKTHLKERTKYLNNFIEYIVKRPFIYYSEIFQLFLKSSSNNISKLLSSFSNYNIIDCYNLNKNAYQKYFENEDNTTEEELVIKEYFDKALSFEPKLDKNITFFVNFHEIINNLIKKIETENIYLNKYNMLYFPILHNKNKMDEEKYKELNATLGEYKELNKLLHYKVLSRKTYFFIQNFKCCKDMFKSMRDLQNYYKKVVAENQKIKLDIKKLEESNKESFGLLKKTNKADLLKDLNTKLKQNEEELTLLHKLIKGLASKLEKEEMGVIRKYKEENFDNMAKRFINYHLEMLSLEKKLVI